MESINTKIPSPIKDMPLRFIIVISGLCLLWFFIPLSEAKAQTWAEIFRQKKTQRKYLIEQIIALKVYSGYVKKGYNIASSGLNTIRGFTKGEFDLHHDYDQSLHFVNNVIASNKKVKQSEYLAEYIHSSFERILRSNKISGPDKQYIAKVWQKLKPDCDTELNNLSAIITPYKLTMTDDERLSRLDLIYRSLQDKADFTKSFATEIFSLANQRQYDLKDNMELEKLYERK